MTYCGRFAPSPSGRLHLGSLVSGYAAYFRSKSQQGKFIIRIEDLDFPRCPKSNTPIVLDELELLGIKSDCHVIIQSEQLDLYHEVLNNLINTKQAYYCACSRAQMKVRPCTCKNNQKNIATNSFNHVAIRVDLLKLLTKHQSFIDGNLGLIEQQKLDHDIAKTLVLKRADNIIAYNFAVVIDDYNEHISEVVRGADMLDATFLQLCLYEILGYKSPKFFHVPLITDIKGNKLSKQNKAPAILCSQAPHQALLTTYRLLGQKANNIDALILKLDRIYTKIQDLIDTKRTALIKDKTLASFNKLIDTLHLCELSNAYLCYGYCCLEFKDVNIGSYFQNIRQNDYLEPKKLGLALCQNLSLDHKENLLLISDYQTCFNELLLNLLQSFNEQNMPHKSIVV